MVVRLKMVGNDLRVAGFIPLRPIKADCKRLERPQACFVRIRNDNAGVQASTQKDPQRYFTHQANAHTLR